MLDIGRSLQGEDLPQLDTEYGRDRPGELDIQAANSRRPRPSRKGPLICCQPEAIRDRRAQIGYANTPTPEHVAKPRIDSNAHYAPFQLSVVASSS